MSEPVRTGLQLGGVAFALVAAFGAYLLWEAPSPCADGLCTFWPLVVLASSVPVGAGFFGAGWLLAWALSPKRGA